jgi:peroxiredoxin
LDACNRTPALAGMWSATIIAGNARVPCRFLIAGSGASLQGSFFNGDQKISSATARMENNLIVFAYPEYGSRLEVTPGNPGLEGNYYRANGTIYTFEAQRFKPAPNPGNIPSIGGLWTIELPAGKRERAWNLIVRQSGAEVSASILRLDGDSGAATGTFDGQSFVLGHFSGARPLRLDLTPKDSTTLRVELDSYDTYTAVRQDEARARGLPEPTDPSRFTSVRDPGVPFAFSFPDIDGHSVANTDVRFQRKVVIVSIGGSWCPNCHDEAPFLMDLYRKYRGQGLEVVFLAFEEGNQLKSLEQLRAFVRRYGVEYPVLVAGDLRLLHEKVPQAVNLEVLPTTFMIGRDGLVRGVRTGFAAEPTGPFHANLKAEVTTEIEHLLAEP